MNSGLNLSPKSKRFNSGFHSLSVPAFCRFGRVAGLANLNAFVSLNAVPAAWIPLIGAIPIFGKPVLPRELGVTVKTVKGVVEIPAIISVTARQGLLRGLPFG